MMIKEIKAVLEVNYVRISDSNSYEIKTKQVGPSFMGPLQVGGMV